MKSVFDAIKAVAAVRPQLKDAGAATIVVVDTQGYNSAMFDLMVGATSGTPDSFSVAAKVQECDNADGTTGAADVTDAAITAITVANKSAQIRMDGLNMGARKRYLTLVVTPAFVNGTSPKVYIAGSALLGRAFKEPVGNSVAAA